MAGTSCGLPVSIHDVELVNSVLIKDFDHFVDRRSMDLNDEIVNEMLTVAKGDHWKAVRSIMSPTFSSGKMKAMFFLVQSSSDALVEACQERKDSDSVINIKSMFGDYTLDVIGSCAFGMEINSLKGENKEFSDAVAKMFKRSAWQIFKFVLFMTVPSIMRLLKVRSASSAFDYFKKVLITTISKR